ncbi:MAG: diguanylate cyclase [Thermodesulfobacteriota bacterium]
MKDPVKPDNRLQIVKKLETEHLKRLNALTTFNEIGKALTSTLDLKEALKIMMEKISELLRPKNWSLLLVDEEKNNLFFEIVVGKELEKLKNSRLKIGEGIAGWVAKEGMPLFVPDAANDNRFTKRIDNITNFVTRSVICVPLKSKGKILGVIELLNTIEEEPFQEEDMTLLTTLADYTAIAVENAKYVQKVQELTITDDLTKLYNSRYLHRYLTYEVERTRRYKTQLSVIFLDLDFFKNVNDTYGHLHGSNLLKEIGELLFSKIRTVDMACRYGGDEFIIVLPHTTKADAFKVAQKIRKAINQKIFLKDEGVRVNITASFGVASVPGDAEDSIGLIRLADQAMYEVKNRSRNDISMA